MNFWKTIVAFEICCFQGAIFVFWEYICKLPRESIISKCQVPNRKCSSVHGHAALQALLRHGLVVWLGAPKLRWQHGRYQGGEQLERFTVFSRNSKNRAVLADFFHFQTLANEDEVVRRRWLPWPCCLPSRLIRGADEMGGRELGCTWFVRGQEMYLNSYIRYTYSLQPLFLKVSTPKQRFFPTKIRVIGVVVTLKLNSIL